MYFTQEDYRKIEAYLKSKAARDTSFDSATTPLQGNETIVLVQGGKNVNTTVSDIVSQFFALGVSDFINVTDKYGISYNTLDEAIRVIPWRSRKVGQVITFLNEQGEWHLYQYQGESVLTWNNTTLWVDLLESRIVNSILPDQEDLTMTEPDADGNSYMHFKNKDYSIDDFSGLGRVYLRKNLQTLTDPNTSETRLINYLTQTMIGKENVIYHIQYDYNLNGQTIIIPEGCVLLFEGGSISNGNIRGNNTKIVSEGVEIFTGVSFNNSFIYSKVNADWFDNLNSAVKFTNNNGGVLQLSNKTYTINEPLVLDNNICIQGVGTEAWGNTGKGTYIKYLGNDSIIKVIGDYTKGVSVKNISIKDLKLVGSANSIGVNLINGVHYIHIDNVTIHNCSVGIYGSIIWHVTCNMLACYSCGIGVHIDGTIGMTSSTFTSCLCYNCDTGFSITNPVIYSSFISCGTDGCKNSLNITGALRGVSFINFGFEKSTESGIVVDNPNAVASFIGATMGAGSKDYNISYFKINSCYNITIIDTFVPSGFTSVSGTSLSINSSYSDKVILINSEFNGINEGLNGCTVLKGRNTIIPNYTNITVTNPMQSSTIPVYSSGIVILKTDNNERELKGTPIFNTTTLPAGSIVTVVNSDSSKQFNIRTEKYTANTGIIGYSESTLSILPSEGVTFIKQADGKLLFRNLIKPLPIGRGIYQNRPTLTVSDTGFMYFDLSIGCYIYWNGTEWINSDGTLVSKVVIV